MDETTQTQPNRVRFDALVRRLSSEDPETREAAAKVFCGVGRLAAELLVQEAVKPDKRLEHVIAILDVVQRIGGPPTLEEMFSLQSLLLHQNPAVQSKAAMAIMAMSPGGLPDNPETIELMRVFNPFLRVSLFHPHPKTRHSAFEEFCRGVVAAARRFEKTEKTEQNRQEHEA